MSGGGEGEGRFRGLIMGIGGSKLKMDGVPT
jgi:hypothetical protein